MVVAPAYAKLPERFYESLPTVEFSQYPVLYWNAALAKQFSLKDQLFSSPVQLAQAYAGHQFGHFSQQLGDGRARLVGDVKDLQGQLHEVHLKGSGLTRFSRGGDGLATLDAVLRELLVSEGMFHLGIPTTRTLAVVSTQSQVRREQMHPGAIQVRTARSHIRVGTFEYFAARGDDEAVKILADEVIARVYPQLAEKPNPYIALFEEVIKRQAELISRWLQVGFIHGVMNTDNTLISAETIDYGPCAFMEQFDPLKVYSSIDRQGRYAYARQAQIIQWNLMVLGYCLLSLFNDNREKATEILESHLARFEDVFKESWVKGMTGKLGIDSPQEGDEILVQDFLALLHKYQIDFTLGFRNLGKDEDMFSAEEFKPWIQRWKTRVGSTDRDAVNPIIIPRNHLVQQAIQAASQNNDFTLVHRLLEALKNPYKDIEEFRDLQKPATEQEQVQATFCGT